MTEQIDFRTKNGQVIASKFPLPQILRGRISLAEVYIWLECAHSNTHGLAFERERVFGSEILIFKTMTIMTLAFKHGFNSFECTVFLCRKFSGCLVFERSLVMFEVVCQYDYFMHI